MSPSVIPKNLIPLAILAALALTAPSALAADAYPGTYEAKASGIKATIELNDRGTGTLRFAAKTACGKVRGKLSLKRAGAGYKAHKVSRGPESTIRTLIAKLQPQEDGTALVGTIKDTLDGGDSKLAGCRGKRTFKAELGKTDAFVPERDTGHYVGQSKAGLPVSFDVVEEDGEMLIRNFAADVQAECYDEDDNESSMVVHVGGLEGEVEADGSLYILHAPDDDTEHEVVGTLGGGEARVDVVVMGVFDSAGASTASGPYSCDSWGALYTAARQA